MWAGGELTTFAFGTLPISISDPKVIRWHTTSFSYVGDLIELDFFGLRRRRIHDIVPILVLLYAAALKLMGYIPEATAIYRSMTNRGGRLAAYGWVGLGDITHTIALWQRLVDAYDDRQLTLFPLVNGLRSFLHESMGWTLAVDASFEEARRCYKVAIAAAPDLPFPWHELARLEADVGNHYEAAIAMTEFAGRLGSKATANSHRAAELEAARLRALAAVPNVDAEDAATLERWHHGRVHVVSKVAQGELRDAEEASRAVRREILVSFRAYWHAEEHLVEKMLSFDPVGSYVVQEGFVSAYTGAPFVTEGGQSPDSSTAYPFYPGREIFSPLFLGGAKNYELYAGPLSGAVRDAVVLPGFADNYFHFLFDTVGALALVEPDQLECRDVLLFSHGLRPFHRDVLGMLGIPPERVRTQKPGRYAVPAKNVIVVDYPTPFTTVHPQTVSYLRDALIGADVDATPGKRVYLERTGARSFGSRTRRELRKIFSHHGFFVVHPETLTVRQQIELVRDAEAIAVDAGAGAANLLFAPPRAKVFILAPLIAYTDAFTPLCALGDLDLYVTLSDARVHPKYLFTWSEAQPDADLGTLEVCLARGLGRPRFASPLSAQRTVSRNSSYDLK
jgi:hypothetical protein